MLDTCSMYCFCLLLRDISQIYTKIRGIGNLQLVRIEKSSYPIKTNCYLLNNALLYLSVAV